ncbi:IS91 family transposase [Acidobacteriota bacterium]
MTGECIHPDPENDNEVINRWEVADIFRVSGPSYRSQHRLPISHLKVMHDIESCRTSHMGGHLEQCDTCGHVREYYNSCRNRHCPKCQCFTKACWLEARKAEVLPVDYFHQVFTLPHELNPVILCNKKVLINLLFKAASETLKDFGCNPDNGLGGTLGFIAILHTWDQTLNAHFHLHCVVPAGAVAEDKHQWIHAQEGFLFPVKALSKVFRGKFLTWFKQKYDNDELIFPWKTVIFEKPDDFSRLVDSLWHKEWVVYSKKPFAGAEHILDYLSRYTHRVAISNDRIIDIDNGKVRFKYRDRRENDTVKVMILTAEKFIRRFLLHVLPTGLTRIRYYGFLANRNRKKNLSMCRRLLGLSSRDESEVIDKSTPELIFELTGVDPTKCPKCKRGTMLIMTDPTNDSFQYRNRFLEHQRTRDTS